MIRLGMLTDSHLQSRCNRLALPGLAHSLGKIVRDLHLFLVNVRFWPQGLPILAV